MSEDYSLNERYEAYCNAITGGNTALAEEHKWKLFEQCENYTAGMKRKYVQDHPGRDDLFEKAQLKAFLNVVDPSMVGTIDADRFNKYFSRSVSNAIRSAIRTRSHYNEHLTGNEAELQTSDPAPALNQADQFRRRVRQQAQNQTAENIEIYCDYIEARHDKASEGKVAPAVAAKRGTTSDGVRKHVSRFRARLSEDPAVARLIAHGEVPPSTLKDMLGDLREIAQSKRDITRYWQELNEESARNSSHATHDRT